jgi:hypothetical protein
MGAEVSKMQDENFRPQKRVSVGFTVEACPKLDICPESGFGGDSTGKENIDPLTDLP